MISKTQRPLPVYDHQIGEGPTLVFLHYWGGSSRTWQLVVDELPGRDIITVDFRGWSRSEGMSGPYTLQQYAADVVAVLTDAGAEDYVLVGHSMGGKVAQLIAATRPQGLRGMVLVASGPARPAEAITQEYRNSLSHAYDSEESVIGVRDAVLTATALSDALKAQIVADSMSSSLEARMEWPLHGIAEDITDKARLVSVPAIVVAGADDPVEPVGVLRENLVPYLSGAEMVVLASTGHLIPLEAAVELTAVITTFAATLRHGQQGAASGVDGGGAYEHSNGHR